MNAHIWPIETLPVAELEEMLSVNVVGTFKCLQSEMKHMKNGGSIVNCGSQQVKYASKNAVRGLSQSAAYEGGARGIRVNFLCLGCIDTDMIKQPLILPSGEAWTMTEDENLTSIIKRYAKPEEIAASIAFLLGDESRFVTKQEWYVDGGGWRRSTEGDH